jgi:hypothetical protein
MDIIVFPYLLGQKKQEENRAAHYFLGSLQDANFCVSGLGSRIFICPVLLTETYKKLLSHSFS